MQFLVLSQVLPGATKAAIGTHLAAEAALAGRYYLDGVIRQAYLRSAPGAAVLGLEADSLEIGAT